MQLYNVVNRGNVYLLNLFGPLRRITKGHEYTVGQNSTHNDHAEKSGEPVKENTDIEEKTETTVLTMSIVKT